MLLKPASFTVSSIYGFKGEQWEKNKCRKTTAKLNKTVFSDPI